MLHYFTFYLYVHRCTFLRLGPPFLTSYSPSLLLGLKHLTNGEWICKFRQSSTILYCFYRHIGLLPVSYSTYNYGCYFWLSLKRCTPCLAEENNRTVHIVEETSETVSLVICLSDTRKWTRSDVKK